MRRLEFREGTSSKFWEIDLDGASFTVSWGRIGTAGQTQTKSFDTAEKARAEHDKLVSEKLKKGYADVGAGAAPATPKPAVSRAAPARPPVAPATPAPAPVDAAPADVSWTDAALRATLPTRSGPYRGSWKNESRAATFEALRYRCAAILGVGTGQPAMQAAKAMLERDAPPEALDLETEAAAVAFFGESRSWNDEARGALFVRYWLASADVELVLRVLVRASRLHETAAGNRWQAETSPWGALRQYLACADDAIYARSRETAAALRSETTPLGRCGLAFAFPDEGWGAEAAREMCATLVPGKWVPMLLAPLTASISDADAVNELIGELMTRQNPWQAMHALTPFARDFVARLGVRAMPTLLLMFEKSQNLGVETVRAVCEALALIATDEAASFFAGQLENKQVRPVAAEYFRRMPRLAIPALAALASGKGSLAETAKSVLQPIALASPAVVEELLPTLPDGSRGVVDNLRKRGEVGPEASADELPEVLARPPWSVKRPASKARAPLSLERLDRPAAIAWKPGQREQWTKLAWAVVKSDKEEELLKSIEAARGKDMPRYQRPNGTLLLQISDASALRVWNTEDPASLSWYYWPVAKVMLARHELAALPGLLRYARFDPTEGVVALERVDAPDAAPIMADALVRLKKSRAAAGEWLVSFPESAAIALVPIALGARGKERDSAETALRHIAARGGKDALSAVARRYGSEAEAGLDEVLAYDPLLAYPAKLPKMPSFWNAAALSRPVLKGSKRALPVAAVEAIGTMLAFSPAEAPYTGLAAVKAACEPASLAELAWELFQAWLLAGAVSKEQWAFLALGHLGNDESARRLTPLVRAWPGEAAHARAVLGLDVLAMIGTDVALMHLHGIAQKVKFKGLQERARAKIDQIAEARGLTGEELADRLVPDLGLDDDGSLALDFGGRSFRVGFDEALKPFVVDSAGKRSADLPKPGRADDAEKAKAATDTWKALKKDAKTVASGQVLRLELAMCSLRRWEPDVFRTFLLEHPLLIHLVRRLVWGVYDASGALSASFRAAEDRTLADANDETFVLPDASDVRIGLPHRLELSEAQAASWGQVLSDYEVIQPFAQLSREVRAPSDAEREALELGTVAGVTVPTSKLFGLDARGWRRGPPQDGGVVCWYEKVLDPERSLQLDLEPGIYTGMVAESPEQKLGKVVIQPNGTWDPRERGRFGELPPIVFSELVRDLESLRA